MSVRIHELAKRLNLDGKDLLALLKERRYVAADTKSVSSTISTIYAEEIEKEFGAKQPLAPAAEAAEAPASPAAPPAVEASKVRMPAGLFVKTTTDLAREKEAAKAAL